MENDSFLKKTWKVFHSMKLGIILLIIIAMLSVIGTLIPQGYSEQYYLQNYPHMLHEIILAFGFDHLFSSWWYILLTAILLLNLFLCSITRFKPIINRVKNNPDIENKIHSNNYKLINTKEVDIEGFFKKLGFNNIKETNIDDRDVKYQFSNKIGYLGSWITHLSIIIIIIAFAYGRHFGFEEFVYGVPGTVLNLENSNYQIQVDDFDINFRDDFTVEQYKTDLTILEDGKVIDKGKTLVNHPYRNKEFNAYQNSTGWAVDSILYKDDKYLSDKTLYKSDIYVEDDKKIALQFVDFYPDFDETNPMHPRTKSPFLNHPVMLYALFYDGERVDMGLVHMGDQIEYEEYAFLVQNPQMFTLLQVTKDPATKFALAGGILLMIGLFLAFYINPKEIILVDTDKPEIKKIFIKQNKKDKIFENKVNELIKDMEVKDGFN
ncbi:cytochrome c biogenesis protein ResB [uncultured Anaerococcus sp.]|uniref:cytochrome c biogenesis protein ResB n=1 Tax=uncultured Anaerococcus sp. TaxID=293428 RepID=UPI00262B3A76|nr:cytochrome c biogenesis protein ResB [uncultured Anaerococcus sp.]